MKPIPHLATELIADLDAAIPHRCPSPEMTEREIFFYAGQRKLVDSLLFRLNNPEKDTDVPV